MISALKTITFAALALLLTSCYQQERNCQDFKTGKFRFEHEVDGVKKVTEFIRNDSIEIETYEGRIDTATVRWINDCEYVLQKKHPRNRAERKAVSIKILTTTKNSYTFEFGLVGSDAKQKGTVTKLD
ncbi:MAG TPA: DNA topoisomerase IV [Flavobacterium sp.]|nr:DNA topoisomerase IV [Flavobacterium sp.]